MIQETTVTVTDNGNPLPAAIGVPEGRERLFLSASPTAGKAIDPEALARALPADVETTIVTVKIAGRTYTRISVDRSAASNADLTALGAAIGALGVTAVIDTCERTKPALDAAAAVFTPIDKALPATVIRLHRAVASGTAR